MPLEERPRERFKKYGPKSLSTQELISIILKTGTKGRSVIDLSADIMNSITSVADLKNLTINSLNNINGISDVKSITLLSSIELGRRIYEYKEEPKKDFSNSSLIYEYYRDKFKDLKQEEFHVLYLNTRKELITSKLLFIGTIDSSVVHPREIFKEAYLNSASYIICMHNHPTGHTSPSNMDINVTRKLVEIGIILSIPVLDHIIIGSTSYYSFFENDRIKYNV